MSRGAWVTVSPLLYIFHFNWTSSNAGSLHFSYRIPTWRSETKVSALTFKMINCDCQKMFTWFLKISWGRNIYLMILRYSDKLVANIGRKFKLAQCWLQIGDSDFTCNMNIERDETSAFSKRTNEHSNYRTNRVHPFPLFLGVQEEEGATALFC